MKIQNINNNTIELLPTNNYLIRQQPTLEPYKIDIVKDNVLANEKYYFGAEKLSYDKSNANDEIKHMNYLNNAQKQSIKI